MTHRPVIQTVAIVGAAAYVWMVLREGVAVDLAVAAAGLTFAGVAAVALPSHRRFAVVSAAAATAWLLADHWSQLLWLHRPLIAATALSFPSGRLQRLGARLVVTLLAVSALFPSAARNPQLTLLLSAGLAACAWWEVKAASPASESVAHTRAASASALALAMAIPAVGHWWGPVPIQLTREPTPMVIGWLFGHVVPGLELLYSALVCTSGGILLVRLLVGVQETEADLKVAVSERNPTAILDMLRSNESSARDAEGQRALVAAASLLERNLALQAELAAAVESVRSSRRSLVEATEFERRSLRRRLAAQALPMIPEMDSQLAGVDEVPGGLVRRCRDELMGIRADLDLIADGLHPAGLARDGLAGLRDVGAAFPMPVTVDVPDQRLPQEIEEATWYASTEALSNAAKHSRASSVRVAFAVRDGVLVGSVTDDGAGGAKFDAGGGLLGLRDRLEAVGGRVALDSRAGVGTCLRIEVPLP